MKINSILIGKGRGSAGNVTVTQLKGQTILKQKATIVANPRTELQMKQRRMINRAVYVWQLLGQSVKQGITSLLPFSSQYNTFVSINSNHFKNQEFTKENFVMSNLIGSFASKGALGTLRGEVAADGLNNITLDLVKSNLNQVAKIGDKLVVIAGRVNGSTAVTSESIVTAELLAEDDPQVAFPDGVSDGVGAFVSAFFLVSNDGSKSTTSLFV